jgi:hypothetical protein
MTPDDVLVRTKGAYLCLIHPLQFGGFWQELAPVIALAPSVPDPLIAAMITGASWRERLLGLCMAMVKGPERFTDAMLQSLRDLRGIAIVPVCAVLAVLARRDVFAMPESFAEMFDRSAFDGEVGWAVDKAMHFAGLRADDVPGQGPNYGQVFEDHVEVYSSLVAS